jgi:hypothetical protein
MIKYKCRNIKEPILLFKYVSAAELIIIAAYKKKHLRKKNRLIKV